MVGFIFLYNLWESDKLNRKVLSFIIMLTLIWGTSSNILAAPTTKDSGELSETRNQKQEIEQKINKMDKEIDSIIKEIDNNKQCMNKINKDVKETEDKLNKIKNNVKEERRVVWEKSKSYVYKWWR